VIEVFVGEGQYQGRAIKVIRVRPVSRSEHYGEGAESVKLKPDQPPSSSLDMDDDVPF
jgi:hypothetical protein